MCTLIYSCVMPFGYWQLGVLHWIGIHHGVDSLHPVTIWNTTETNWIILSSPLWKVNVSVLFWIIPFRASFSLPRISSLMKWMDLFFKQWLIFISRNTDGLPYLFILKVHLTRPLSERQFSDTCSIRCRCIKKLMIEPDSSPVRVTIISLLTPWET